MITTAMIILIAYLVYVYHRVGIPDCLSDTAYTVNRHLFACVMLSIGALMWLPLINATAEYWQFLVFTAEAGILAMAVSPYKDGAEEHNIHYIGTALAMLSIVSLWLTHGGYSWIVGVITSLAMLASFTAFKKGLLIAELICFGSAFAYGYTHSL